MRVRVDGQLAPGVSSKDIILYVIGKIGTAGGNGAVIEYCGSAIESLSMEGRMSIVSFSRTSFDFLQHCIRNSCHNDCTSCLPPRQLPGKDL